MKKNIIQMMTRSSASGARDRITDCGKEARNNTLQTPSKTTSLNRNSPVKFQAIGSVDRLHLTTPEVMKKKDHAMAKEAQR